MYFDIANKSCNEDDLIRFLNSSAKDFYDNKFTFKDEQYFMLLKSRILAGLTDVERVIRGTFDCDLYLKNANCDMLKEMFPNAYKMFKIDNDNDIERLGSFLSTFRNINAHAFLGDADLELFTLDYSFLLEQDKFNNNIKYYDGDITLAGLLFILFNFLRKESIAVLCKQDFIFSVISCGSYSKDNGVRFVSKISKVNLEIEIRKEGGDTLFDSVFGQYKEKVLFNDGWFEIKIGRHNYPTYKISGRFSDDKLSVDKGSLSKAFYKDDYNLIISDQESFIKISNELPPFILVDYLYELGIKEFTQTVAAHIKSNMFHLSKLNKPKFYTDKNIQILLLPDTVSDFRMVSSVCGNALKIIMLSIEYFVYSTRNIDRSNEYSTIGTALKHLNAPDELIKEVKYVRNFAMHGYLLGERIVYKDENRTFSMKYIIETLYNMMRFFKKNCFDVYQCFMQCVEEYLIDILISVKYKSIIKFTRDFLSNYPNASGDEYNKMIGFVNNAILNINDFYCFFPRSRRILIVHIPQFAGCLYLYNTKNDKKLLDEFCKKNGYVKKQKGKEGFFIQFELEESH